MKVYVVGSGYAFERSVNAVYSTRELAERALENCVGEDIEEYEFDPDWTKQIIYQAAWYRMPDSSTKIIMSERWRVLTPEDQKDFTEIDLSRSRDGTVYAVTARSTDSFVSAVAALNTYLAEHSLEMAAT